MREADNGRWDRREEPWQGKSTKQRRRWWMRPSSTVSKKQVEDIAKLKMPDLSAGSLEAAIKTVEGTARSMGITVEG